MRSASNCFTDTRIIRRIIRTLGCAHPGQLRHTHITDSSALSTRILGDRLLRQPLGNSRSAALFDHACVKEQQQEKSRRTMRERTGSETSSQPARKVRKWWRDDNAPLNEPSKCEPSCCDGRRTMSTLSLTVASARAETLRTRWADVERSSASRRFAPLSRSRSPNSLAEETPLRRRRSAWRGDREGGRERLHAARKGSWSGMRMARAPK